MRWAAVAGGVAAVVLGSAGLVRAAIPQHESTGSGAPGTISVSGAYVRAPAPPTDAAAAYFTVYNTTGQDDRLTQVVSGAGATSTLHVESGGSMVAAANGLVIPAHGSVVLSTGKGHVMIEHLFDKLTAGQTVNLELDFRTAGPIDVVAPVIALGAPAPTGTAPSSSGAHS
ncbi:MAG TPA: copper chaperone PCu(A)C [Jatrophihabitans sp.]|jgi:hypothetical protein|uniref:copper chaperone PCu(A)C n=1 Tax=Jatrophihabitans sp. TaxID=1932789 RepID=UPI002E0232B4|nr:copper chaperone PCu(A)C [Jatrophihabitans sp.]